jgi:hypothetical protein
MRRPMNRQKRRRVGIGSVERNAYDRLPLSPMFCSSAPGSKSKLDIEAAMRKSIAGKTNAAPAARR